MTVTAPLNRNLSRKTKPASQEWMSRLLPYMPREELLGLWIAENEGAKCWANVLTELQNRGLKDIFIACVDGLKGFPEAINTVYPKTKIQLCIVHLVRNSLKFVSWKDYKAVTADLKQVYQAPTP
ncbi:putative transposase [Glaesserella parasuis D74]|nr:putative transposase [Glaesserella parasuis D74]